MLFLLSSSLMAISATLIVFSFYTFSQRKKSAVALHLSFLLLLLSIYAGAYSLELRSSVLSKILLWNRIEYFGISFLPSVWLILTARYINFQPLLKRWVIALMLLISASTLFSALTDPFLHLRYSSVWISTNGPFPILGFTRGVSYWIHTAFSLFSLAAGSILLARNIPGTPKFFRKQILLMFIGVSIPWVVYIFYLLGFNKWGIDTIPFSMFVSAICFGTAIFGFKILDVTPVARSVVFEMMSDGAIVIDLSGHIIDYNKAAAETFPGLTQQSLSENLKTVLPGCVNFAEHADSLCDTEFQFNMETENGIRHFECRSTIVRNSNNSPIAQVVLFKDNTASIQLMHRLNELATMDPLTRLYNRRHFIEISQRQMKHLERNSLPISIVILDLDHFKNINDTYGHLAGDEVLRTIASILSSTVRANDTVARFGGEEFICLLPGARTHDACIIAERMRVSVRDTQIEFEGKKISITASFGLAGIITAREGTESIDILIARADKALYKAKNDGRNRTAVWDDSLKE